MIPEDIRVGVVGAGFWATEMHLPALSRLPGVRVTAIAARTESSALAAADRFNVPSWTTDWQELVGGDEVDVVDIVAPNHLHAPIAIAALGLGKHVICIKPLAMDLGGADRMLAATRTTDARLFYAENVPFIPAVRRAAEIVREGGLGEVFRVKACEGIGAPHAAWFLDPAQSGGGAAIDMAVHSIAFCRSMARSEVDTVYAETGTFVHRASPVEDTVVMTLRFRNDVIGQCEDGWSLVAAMDSRFEVFGTKGRILIDNLHRQPIQVASEPGYAPLGGDRESTRGWTFPLPMSGDVADGHLAMLNHFVECLRSGERSLSEGEEGRADLAVVEAALRSSRSGRREPIISTLEEAG
ncbi:MAG: Gfo/Idh/MocA family protein [Candidatus Dormibacteraceae bacterium]